jgi:hypothetical protein
MALDLVDAKSEAVESGTGTPTVPNTSPELVQFLIRYVFVPDDVREVSPPVEAVRFSRVEWESG